MAPPGLANTHTLTISDAFSICEGEGVSNCRKVHRADDLNGDIHPGFAVQPRGLLCLADNGAIRGDRFDNGNFERC